MLGAERAHRASVPVVAVVAIVAVVSMSTIVRRVPAWLREILRVARGGLSFSPLRA